MTPERIEFWAKVRGVWAYCFWVWRFITLLWSRASEGSSYSTTSSQGAWRHWHQILFEYGHIFGADLAEKYPAQYVMYLV